MKFLITAFVCFLVSLPSMANEEINKVLDSFHLAAAEADGTTYFSLLAENSVFLGTDPTERWTKAQFKTFAEPYFSKGKGWKYVTRQRHVTETNNPDIVFFDELLDNDSYGLCRGSGVVMKIDGRWQILQYNLSIPIPNDLSKVIVNTIESASVSKQGVN
ncbi:nuclear transport factor 2 family protein [Thalassotalea marina]|uniref:SnoaL-like domain-containing protein n=1 Tax=Thalassotalea marina TaxID=1673741 RepID=A0A919BE86_9GAMM|nr:nuclear transport factor 2 family protein [Thalassotalea marina]GHF82240.1 hypothetical protein GCM10017161_06770 [Thalassotalea marina]